jgi:orotate phosphoribosyltransferase-like protein
MDFNKLFSDYITSHLKKHGISKTYVAGKINISRNYLYMLLANKKKWNQELISSICVELNIIIEFREAV